MRHYGRENPLGDTTKIIIGVGVAAAVVGVGYYLWRQRQTPSAGSQLLQPGAALKLPAPTKGTPAPGTPQGGSTQTGDSTSATSYATLSPATSMVSAVSQIQATSSGGATWDPNANGGQGGWVDTSPGIQATRHVY